MATIINARDVLLQAAATRVAGVVMSPNLVVDPSQVTGLGLVMEGTKLITIEASSQVLLVPISGTPTPSVFNIAIKVYNLTGTISLTVISGTLANTPTLTGGFATIPYTDITTASVVLRATVVEDGITYYDDITIVKSSEGNTALAGYLTNQRHSVPKDSLGNVTNYGNAAGTFKVYQGLLDITNLCTFSIVNNPSSLQGSISPFTGVYAVTGGFPTGSSSVFITYRATFGALTIDRTLDLVKVKTGGVAGTAGADGDDGIRGSRTFFVTLSGSTATYSNSLATTTASVDGGPVRNDVVTQSNDSQGFSQTKFWDGTTWQIVNAVVDGNLLVSGTVGANALSANSVSADKIQAGAITTNKLLVTGKGRAINDDPAIEDASAWTLTGSGTTRSTGGSTAAGVAGQNYWANSTSASDAKVESRRFLIDPAKAYKLTANLYCSSTNDRKMLIFVNFWDKDGVKLTTAWGSTMSGYVYFSTPTAGQFTRLGGLFGTGVSGKAIPSDAKSASIGVWFQYSASGTTAVQQGAQDIRIEEAVDFSLVVDGGIKAANIDSNGLVIRDASGNPILISGSSLKDTVFNTGPNLIRNPDFNLTGDDNGDNSPNGWTRDLAGTPTVAQLLKYTTFPAHGPTWDKNQGMLYANSPTNTTDYIRWYTTDKISVNPAQDYFISCWAREWAAGSNTYLGVICYDDTDTSLGNVYPTGLSSNDLTTTWTRIGGILGPSGVAFPSGTVKVRPVWYGQYHQAGATFATRFCFNEGTVASLDTNPMDPSLVSTLNLINSSNASTYIASAAIGTAQVGVLTAANLTVGAVSNTINGTTSSGARVEVTTNLIKVYDASNVIRIKLGNLA